MADIRIKDLTTTAAASSADDYIAVDGTSNGTRKLSAATPSFATSVTVPGVVGPTSTDLTLTGGSSGASLVLGQGAAAGNASLFTTGTGVVKLGDVNGGSQVWLPGFTTVTGYNSISLSRSSNYGDLMLGRNLTGDNTQTTDSYFTPTTQGAGGYGGIEFQYGGTTRFYAASGATTAGAVVTPALRMTLAETGNLLIGTTTDMTGSGGLKIAGTTAATNTTSGALIVAGGVGVSGAGYFGGDVNAGGTSTAAQFFTGTQGITSGVSSAFAVGVTSATTADVLSFGATARSGLLRGYHDGGGTITWQFGRYAGSFENWAELTGYSVATSGLKLYGTTPSTGSTSGALQVAGGIYAGAASVFGGAVSIGNTVSSVSPTSPNRTITIVVGGVTLYIAAKTTND